MGETFNLNLRKHITSSKVGLITCVGNYPSTIENNTLSLPRRVMIRFETLYFDVMYLTCRFQHLCCVHDLLAVWRSICRTLAESLKREASQPLLQVWRFPSPYQTRGGHFPLLYIYILYVSEYHLGLSNTCDKYYYTIASFSPANTRRQAKGGLMLERQIFYIWINRTNKSNVALMLGQRRRRWLNIKPALAERLD